VEANRKLETVNREKYLIDTALNQIRLILGDVERKRGKPYFESDPVSKQVPGMLVHTFERFVQEMNSDVDQKKSRITEVGSVLSMNSKYYIGNYGKKMY
jgi:hypothetical protein